MADDKRLKILTDSEVDDLYGVPAFTDAQRGEYFYLDEEEKVLIPPHNDDITNAYRLSWGISSTSPSSINLHLRR